MLTLALYVLSALAHAEPMPTIYSCVEQKVAVFDWNEGGTFSKAGLEAKITENDKTTTITFVVSGKKAMFKGNNGEAPLERLDDVTFIERPTGGGNIIMWKLIPASAKVPTLLVQFKGYQIVTSPYIHAWVFKCA